MPASAGFRARAAVSILEALATSTVVQGGRTYRRTIVRKTKSAICARRVWQVPMRWAMLDQYELVQRCRAALLSSLVDRAML